MKQAAFLRTWTPAFLFIFLNILNFLPNAYGNDQRCINNLFPQLRERRHFDPPPPITRELVDLNRSTIANTIHDLRLLASDEFDAYVASHPDKIPQDLEGWIRQAFAAVLREGQMRETANITTVVHLTAQLLRAHPDSAFVKARGPLVLLDILVSAEKDLTDANRQALVSALAQLPGGHPLWREPQVISRLIDLVGPLTDKSPLLNPVVDSLEMALFAFAPRIDALIRHGDREEAYDMAYQLVKIEDFLPKQISDRSLHSRAVRLTYAAKHLYSQARVTSN